MKSKELKEQISDSSLSAKMWLAFGGLLAIGLVFMFVRETPAMARELKIMRM